MEVSYDYEDNPSSFGMPRGVLARLNTNESHDESCLEDSFLQLVDKHLAAKASASEKKDCPVIMHPSAISASVLDGTVILQTLRLTNTEAEEITLKVADCPFQISRKDEIPMSSHLEIDLDPFGCCQVVIKIERAPHEYGNIFETLILSLKGTTNTHQLFLPVNISYVKASLGIQCIGKQNLLSQGSTKAIRLSLKPSEMGQYSIKITLRCKQISTAKFLVQKRGPLSVFPSNEITLKTDTPTKICVKPLKREPRTLGAIVLQQVNGTQCYIIGFELLDDGNQLETQN